MSAPYRISTQEGQRDLESLARESCYAWRGSVWSSIETIRRLVERLFRGNTEDLWDFS